MRGILLVNKAKNMTSHDVVAILRRKLKIKRIGHTGTLDPMVTGVLPICIGNATRVSQYIMDQGKTYIGSLKFGKSTTTYDSYGQNVDFSDKTSFSEEEILGAISNFTGTIEQTPPIYSAIKISGKKLYDYARQDEDIDIPKRKVNIYSFDLLEKKEDGFVFKVHCSKGTYIRSLVHELGLFLGTYAYMEELTRVKVGEFSLEECIDIDKIDEVGIVQIEEKLFKIEDCLYNLARVYIYTPVIERLVNGQRINLNELDYKISKNHLDEIDFNNIMVFVDDEFLGIGKIVDKIIKMERVLKSD